MKRYVKERETLEASLQELMKTTSKGAITDGQLGAESEIGHPTQEDAGGCSLGTFVSPNQIRRPKFDRTKMHVAG